MNKYWKLISNTLIFAIGTFSSKVLVFFLMPLYTSVLSEAEYGTVDLMVQIGNFLLPLVSCGIINGIINAVIFYLMHLSEPELLFSEADIFHDFALTGVLLGILLFVIVVPLTRMDLRKGVFSLPGAAGGAFPLVSSSYAVSILGVGALAAVVMTATVSLMGVGAFACVLLPLPLTVTGLMLLKGLVCACAGAVAGYITICYVVRSGKSEA